MASQDDEGIPVTFSHPQQQVRLLELPPAVVDIIRKNPETR